MTLLPGPIRIADFEPGTDCIDLSAFPLLHDPAQLEATPLAHGIRLSFGTTATVNTTTTRYHEVVRLVPPWPAAVPDA